MINIDKKDLTNPGVRITRYLNDNGTLFIYYSEKGKNASKNQSRHYTTNTTANVDHVEPIDQLIDKYGSKSKESP